eukprot:s2556_g5.t1
MPGDGTADSDEGSDMSSMEAAETAAARTPRDHQRHGPPGPHELLPRGPPPPRPVSEQLPLRRATEVRIDPADAQPEPSDSDSQPERRWPTLDGARVAGPRLPDGRFERSGSSEADSSGDNADDDPNEAVATDSGSDTGSSTWSTTTLVLAANCLEHARETLVQLYRQQLNDTDLLTSRELGGRVGGLRRRLANKDWQGVKDLAAGFLEGRWRREWNEYVFCSTHERRPRNRRPQPY